MLKIPNPLAFDVIEEILAVLTCYRTCLRFCNPYRFTFKHRLQEVISYTCDTISFVYISVEMLW